MLPNFIIGGGVAAGTSFLSAMLTNHKDIYLPKTQRPEPNFFHYTWKFNKGLDWYRQTWFHEVEQERAIGERSSLLLTSQNAARRLKDTFPDIKLIFCLRNPIERAWANYRFTVLEGFEPLPFDEAIDLEERRMQNAEGQWGEIQPHAYLTRSRYASHLREFIDLFGKDRILLLKSEDLGRNPLDAVNLVCKFLEVDPTQELPIPPNYSSPSVFDRTVQMNLRHHFGDRFPTIVESIRKEEAVSSMIVSESDQLYLEMLRSNLQNKKDTLPESARRRLQILLANDIKTVQKLVNFSVDDWI